MYDGVGVGDGLDDLDGTPEKTEDHRQRYQAQLRAFNASVVETNSGGVFNAPSGGGEESDSSLCSSDGGGGSGGNDSTNNTVGSGNESTPTPPYLRDGGEGTGGGQEGESARLSPALSYFTSTSDSGEGVAWSVLFGRGRRILENMEGLPELTAGRTCGGTRAGALLAKLEPVREEMRAFNVDNAPSPGECEFGFRPPIGIRVGQAECVLQNWSDIQASEVYEECLKCYET